MTKGFVKCWLLKVRSQTELLNGKVPTVVMQQDDKTKGSYVAMLWADHFSISLTHSKFFDCREQKTGPPIAAQLVNEFLNKGEHMEQQGTQRRNEDEGLGSATKGLGSEKERQQHNPSNNGERSTHEQETSHESHSEEAIDADHKGGEDVSENRQNLSDTDSAGEGAGGNRSDSIQDDKNTPAQSLNRGGANNKNAQAGKQNHQNP